MKVVIAAVDGSPRSPSVVRAAVAMAERFDACVVLVRALTLHPDLPEKAFAMKPEQVADLVREQALADLRFLEHEIPPSRRRGIRAVFGAPHDVIGRFASSEDADLIVVGSHGYGGFDHVLGTTAASIVNHATRPVLVVRDAERLVDRRPAGARPSANAASQASSLR